MNLTLGFIAFFISIVIPGILFRRFFFYGEFSKQFNTKDPVLHSIFFSIIPGIVIQVLCFFLYYIILDFESSFLNIFTILRDITSDGSKPTEQVTKDFINNELISFIFYSLFVFTFASILGFITSRFIRSQKWDMKYKLFRFKNQWYYIFSGEVLKMKKFEEAHRVSFNKNNNFEDDTLMTYADILVSVSDDNNRKELYTGYVVDYDLSSDDITQLDKIYLIDTHRYKKTEDKSRNRIKVPGDIFILSAKNIININLTYIPSTNRIKEKENKKQKDYKKIQKIYFYTILTIVVLHFFYKLLSLDKTFLSTYLTETGFFGKLLVIVIINQFLSLFVPFKDNENKLCYDNSDLQYRILVLVILSIILYITI